ncbi:MAG: hypothetical protein LBQ79_05225 [Deltaproteobacteria bacterium]|nr:hypothetical protein [Deltaproteobacteria bacterium]
MPGMAAAEIAVAGGAAADQAGELRRWLSAAGSGDRLPGTSPASESGLRGAVSAPAGVFSRP